VVRNRAISTRRSDQRRVRREHRSAVEEACFESAPLALDAATASQALAELQPELREAVVARVWGELTFSEIGELCGTSSSTAQRRYEQGLLVLQARLEKLCTTANRPTSD
jgi:DNA-directed RNA polymerase specialized sigma24 family protein